MTDIYRAPGSSTRVETERAVGHGPVGSVDVALAGTYEVDIGRIVNDAWARTEGNKLVFFVATLVCIGVPFLIGGVVGAAFVAVGLGPDPAAEPDLVGTMASQVAQGLITTPLTAPFGVALMLLGIDAAQGESLDLGRALGGAFRAFVPLALTALVVMFITGLGYVLLVLPGIYLAVAYVFGSTLVAQGIPPWKALELSRIAVTAQWPMVALTLVLIFVIVMLSAIPCGIGLFWTIPFSYIALGDLYRRIFGDLDGLDRYLAS